MLVSVCRRVSVAGTFRGNSVATLAQARVGSVPTLRLAPRRPRSPARVLAMSFSYSPTFFQHFPKHHAPHLKPGEELKDPLDEMKPRCLTHCSSWLAEDQECVNRISLRTDGHSNCKGQVEELIKCQNHCIARELFAHMK